MPPIESPPCIFCGGNTIVQNRKTGTDWEVNPGKSNYWAGVPKERRRHYVQCNRCRSRGPMKPTAQEAVDAYRIGTSTTTK